MVREILDLFIPHQIDIAFSGNGYKGDVVFLLCFLDNSFLQLQLLLAEIRRFGEL